MSLTTIPVSKEVRDQLRQLASQGETHDDLLRRLMEGAEARYLYEREKRILETEEFIPLDGTLGSRRQDRHAPAREGARDAHRRIRERPKSLGTTGSAHEVHPGRDM